MNINVYELMASLVPECEREGFLALTTAMLTRRKDGPDHFDGCDHEGFVGGCERFGHSSENCPRRDPEADMPEVE